MSQKKKIVLSLVLLGALLIFPPLLLMGLFAWHFTQTRGLKYFGKARAQREQFKARLATLSVLLKPLPYVLGEKQRAPNHFAHRYQEMVVPGNTISLKSLKAAVQYQPQAEDIFVVTQMKSGTTWMQYLVYEILQQGRGDLSDRGHNHLCAMSPWLESMHGVSVDAAPLIGVQGQRIIKTHLPARMCPYSAEAKYIYVTRHPVSCYRSCAEFFEAVAGPLAPRREVLLDWFCSSQMWFGPWPEHVAGFWEWAQTRENVLFVHFEELKTDLPEMIRTVAEFLGVALDADAVQRIADKSSFRSMKAQEAYLEMLPPSFFSVGQSFFKRGILHHQEELDAGTRERVLDFCRDGLRGKDYPFERFYPDLV